MFRYANPYDFEPRVAEGDQVDYMDIVQGVDEFDGQDVRLLSFFKLSGPFQRYS